MVAHGGDGFAGSHGQGTHQSQNEAVIVDICPYSFRQRQTVSCVGRAPVSALDQRARVHCGIFGMDLFQDILFVDPASRGQDAGPAADGIVHIRVTHDGAEHLAVLYQQVFYRCLEEQFHPKLFALGNQKFGGVGTAPCPALALVGGHFRSLVRHVENVPARLILVRHALLEGTQPVEKPACCQKGFPDQRRIQHPVGLIHVLEQLVLQVIVAAVVFLPLAVVDPEVRGLDGSAAQKIRFLHHDHFFVGDRGDPGCRRQTCSSAAQHQHITRFIHR